MTSPPRVEQQQGFNRYYVRPDGSSVSSRYLDLLRRVTRQMTAAADLEAVLSSIMRGLVEHADATIARIWLYTTDDACDVCKARRGPKTDERRLHLMAGAGLGSTIDSWVHTFPIGGTGGPGFIAQTRTALLVNDVQNDPRLPDHAPYIDFDVREYGLYAGTGIPLLFHGELLGVLGLFFRRPIEESEFEHLYIFADQAATAIKSAQLFADVARHKERLAVENAYLQEEIRADHGFTEIIGASPALADVLVRVRQVAPAESTVLLTGETGTGKELLARAIHNLSARKDRAMIKVNCGAISAGLVESELFGHEKGAFTGALQRRIGRFELADKGTLFMDEVGELSSDTQVKLLRVLQEQEFERVGGSRPIVVDVRLVAATNRDLDAEVAAGRFRSDLFYRLNVFPIRVPPLRERRADIPLLVKYFLAHFQRRLVKPLTGVTHDSMERLQRYSWPGNIRELQNVLERSAVLSSGPVIEVREALGGAAESVGIAATGDPLGTLDDMERAHIRRVLDATGGVIAGPNGAAKILGLHANTLRSRMERLGMT